MTIPILSWMRTDRLVVVLRSDHVARPAACAAALLEIGVRCIELTFTDRQVLDGIRTMATIEGVAIGAGTVPDAEAAAAAVDAGASFLVTPGLNEAVARLAGERDVPFLEGAHTPTEVAAAVSHGASAIKVFPASTGGPSHLRALLGPFAGAALVPSGGVTSSNAGAYLDAGAMAVSASVTTAEALRSADIGALREGAARLRAAIDAWTAATGSKPLP